MYDKILNGIKSRYPNISACVIVKLGENELFRIDGGVEQRCAMSPSFFSVCTWMK